MNLVLIDQLASIWVNSMSIEFAVNEFGVDRSIARCFAFIRRRLNSQLMKLVLIDRSRVDFALIQCRSSSQLLTLVLIDRSRVDFASIRSRLSSQLMNSVLIDRLRVGLR
jgi:hypothetical protein